VLQSEKISEKLFETKSSATDGSFSKCNINFVFNIFFFRLKSFTKYYFDTAMSSFWLSHCQKGTLKVTRKRVSTRWFLVDCGGNWYLPDDFWRNRFFSKFMLLLNAPMVRNR